MRASSATAAVLLVLAAGAWPDAARADFRQSYSRGLDAAADGKWAEVDARMREAQAEEATPQAKVKIYGMRFEPYIPRYYMGLAAYRQGNCRGAVDNWQHAATRSIVQGDARLAGVMSAGMSDCERKLAATAPATATPTTTSPTSTAPTTATPTTTAPTRPPATTPTTTPTRPVAETPPRPPPATPPTRPPPTAPPARPPATPPSTAASAAPAALGGAYDAYLSGRYDQVAALDVAQFGENRSRFHALLVRAAARFTLSQLRGEAGQAMAAQAQADIRSAKALDAARQPDAALFSPRFRQLYATTR